MLSCHLYFVFEIHFCKTYFLAYISQPTFQRRFNVVSMLWINVEITLMRCWKWNKIWRRIYNVAQGWYNVGVRIIITGRAIYLITCSAWCMSASIHIICTLSDDSGNYFFWSFFSLVHLTILCRQCSSFAACKLICSSLFLLLVRYICWDIMASVLPRNTISRHVWRNNYILLYLWSLIFVFLVAIKHPYEFAIFTVT